MFAAFPEELRALLKRMLVARLSMEGPVIPGGEASQAISEDLDARSIEIPPKDKLR